MTAQAFKASKPPRAQKYTTKVQLEEKRKEDDRKDIIEKMDKAMKDPVPPVEPYYWKKGKGYVEAPEYNSCKKYNLTKKKYWAQEDVLLMDEYKDEPNLEPDVTKPHREYNKEKAEKIDKN